jgi:DNA-binding response OmpR family regulator
VSERLREQTVRLDIGGIRLSIAGNLVTIGEDPVLFTDTEAQVLTLLAVRPNVVHAKTDLLRAVWRDEDADPHVVEVAVGRLRQRMGPLGGSITSVYRRGYTLKTEDAIAGPSKV